jgi:thiosulfate dehydrogenase
MLSIRLFFTTLSIVLFLSQPAVSQKAASKPQKQRVVIQVPKDPSLIWMVAVGGRGYDNWAALSRAKIPQRTHPSYPKTGKQKGWVTWLCHECHGWDYRGKDGAYGSGPHYTGIKGLISMRGKDPDDVFSAIRGGVHVYPKKLLPDIVAERIALFVSQGQYNPEFIIDDKTGKPLKGDPTNGRPHYQNLCALCHGFDGKARNFGTLKKPVYVGTIANQNPWAFMHKLRVGQPRQAMVALMSLPITVLEDLFAYAQKLPQK